MFTAVAEERWIVNHSTHRTGRVTVTAFCSWVSHDRTQRQPSTTTCSNGTARVRACGVTAAANALLASPAKQLLLPQTTVNTRSTVLWVTATSAPHLVMSRATTLKYLCLPWEENKSIQWLYHSVFISNLQRDVFTTITSVKVMFCLPIPAGGHQIAATTFIYNVLI